MASNMLKKQSRIHDIFEAMSVLGDAEWSNLDDSCTEFCQWCDGFKEWKWDRELEGHRSSCRFVSVQRKLFSEAVNITDSLEDGNTFLNLVVGLFLSRQKTLLR